MLDKKVGLIFLAILFVVSSIVSYAYFSFVKGGGGLKSAVTGYNVPQNGSSQKTPIDPSAPKTEACPLNGEMLTKAHKTRWEGRRPLGIMVENHTEARPQSGLSSADVIYEAVAEGGITRFLAVYYCQDAAFVGPVRSARIYFVKLIQGYGQYPLYAHVGGANTDGPADALGEIDDLEWAGYNDLNQFSVPFPNFWRDYERLPNRATEHTVYTSTSKLWDFARTKRQLSNVDAKGNSWNKGFTPWKFKDDAAAAKRGTVKSISFGFWDYFANEYAVTWAYDKATNTYVRENGGTLHLDKNTGKAMKSKTVVVVFAEESPANDGYPGGHLLYGIVGKGDALVFQDGQAISATWKKADEESMIRFYDESGKEMELNRGQVFVEILPEGNKVTY